MRSWDKQSGKDSARTASQCRFVAPTKANEAESAANSAESSVFCLCRSSPTASTPTSATSRLEQRRRTKLLRPSPLPQFVIKIRSVSVCANCGGHPIVSAPGHQPPEMPSDLDVRDGGRGAGGRRHCSVGLHSSPNRQLALCLQFESLFLAPTIRPFHFVVALR